MEEEEKGDRIIIILPIGIIIFCHLFFLLRKRLSTGSSWKRLLLPVEISSQSYLSQTLIDRQDRCVCEVGPFLFQEGKGKYRSLCDRYPAACRSFDRCSRGGAAATSEVASADVSTRVAEGFPVGPLSLTSLSLERICDRQIAGRRVLRPNPFR